MTFIASVIAKDGVAIIADSLVTSVAPSIDFESFRKFVKATAQPDQEIEDVQLKLDDLMNLFKNRASYTRDYEQKLFQYDSHTAITFAGEAQINGHRIAKLVDMAMATLQAPNQHYEAQSMEQRLDAFATFISAHLIAQLDSGLATGTTSFVFTHYNVARMATEIYKLTTLGISPDDYAPDAGYSLVRMEPIEDRAVFCDGQNNLAERMLLGDIYNMEKWMKIVVAAVKEALQDHGVAPQQALIQKFYDFDWYLYGHDFSDVNDFKIDHLSLQEAVDMAQLLMKAEIGFQKFTQKLPTVGGKIRLAVIDRSGFRNLKGHHLDVE